MLLLYLLTFILWCQACKDKKSAGLLLSQSVLKETVFINHFLMPTGLFFLTNDLIIKTFCGKLGNHFPIWLQWKDFWTANKTKYQAPFWVCVQPKCLWQLVVISHTNISCFLLVIAKKDRTVRDGISSGRCRRTKKLNFTEDWQQHGRNWSEAFAC